MHESIGDHRDYPLDIFVGTKYNQLKLISTAPQSESTTLKGQSSSPISSIVLNEQSSKAGSIAIFTDQTKLYELVQDEHCEQIRNIPFTYRLRTLFEIPHATEYFIGCHQQRSYFATTRAGEIYYGRYQGDSQFLTTPTFSKLYDYSDIFPAADCPNTRQQYRRSLFKSSMNDFECVFIGKAVLPFLYDFNKGVVAWRAKNVRNDELDLQVPIDDVDCCSYKTGATLAVANTQNKIRVYDVRGQRRKPLIDVKLKIDDKASLTRLKISPCENYMYVGSHSGNLCELDLRKNFGVCGKFKGIATSIQDIYINEQYLVSCSLDSYVRVFNRNSKKLEIKKYINASPVCLDARASPYSHDQLKQQEAIGGQHPRSSIKKGRRSTQQEAQDEVDKPAKAAKLKGLRSRNKVGLWYLKPENIQQFSDVDSNQDHYPNQIKKEQNSEDISGDYYKHQGEQSSISEGQ